MNPILNSAQSFIRMVGNDFQDLSQSLVSQKEKISDKVINSKLSKLEKKSLKLSLEIKEIANSIAVLATV